MLQLKRLTVVDFIALASEKLRMSLEKANSSAIAACLLIGL
ncbi:MAG: hypothetical protein WCP16_12110 [Pseudanabaena sp. ELA645]